MSGPQRGPKTEQHHYHREYLEKLRRRIIHRKQSADGSIDTESALEAVRRGKRFSLPGPSAHYEREDFDPAIAGMLLLLSYFFFTPSA